jgi:hypothetical protein
MRCAPVATPVSFYRSCERFGAVILSVSLAQSIDAKCTCARRRCTRHGIPASLAQA